MIIRRLTLLLTITFVLAFRILFGQESNLVIRKIAVSEDTVQLDSLTISPSSFRAYCGDDPVSSTDYYFNGVSRAFFYSGECGDSLVVVYRKFNFDISANYQLMDTSIIYRDRGEEKDYYFQQPEAKSDFFGGDGIRKSGSISRGVNFGNSQDLSVNSTLNLQLSGKVTENMEILATVTDDNLPIQPDGNTNQLQEFDQVFIQLFGDQYKIIAGDFWLRKPKGHFMNYNKRAQGLYGQYGWENESGGKWTVQGAGAFSKGKFSRNTIQGVEGNQGPYRLRGNENEPFIIVLAGTEKVYLDGKLMKRGQEFDYTVNYNTSEITFTPRHQITKDVRIIVEFQYTDQNYARSLFQGHTEYESDKFDFWLNMYSEQDAKNQTIQQDLSTEQRQLLSSIGDSLELARSTSIDSIGFVDNQVTYKLIDSVGIDSVLVYSVDPDSAVYRATFTQVGQGNGDYVFDRFTAVGRVYKWVQPVGGLPQGNYAPSRLIVTPKRRAMITSGASYRFNDNFKITTELSTTNNDVNTFSREDSGDDRAYAGMTTLEGIFDLGYDSIPSWQLITKANIEYRTAHFQFIERYRGVEFDRDWNIRDRNYQGDQFLANLGGGIRHKDFGTINLEGQNFTLGKDYQGNRARFSGDWNQNGFKADWDGSYLNARAENQNTYLRHVSDISQRLGPVKIGFKDDHELNEFVQGDSLLRTNSYQWYDWQVYLANADSSRNNFRIFYRERYDWKSDSTNLERAAKGRSVGGSYEWLSNRRSRLNTMVSYRSLEIENENLINATPENTFLGRIDHQLKLFSNALTLNTFYEVGSGLELRKEFLYIEVNTGQGVYTWIDYNNDGIKDLNEFEVAQYADQANYIRVFTPSNEYVRTYSNEFNQSLFWRPERIWASDKGFKKLLSRFSNQTRFRVNQKTSNQTESTYNPLDRVISDTSLISFNSTVRNTLFFNRTNPIFGADYTYSETGSKTLLANGFDAREIQFHNLSFRWNIKRKFTLKTEAETGRKVSQADYTSGRNYGIDYTKVEPEFIYQPNTKFRIALVSRYEEKRNDENLGGEIAFVREVGLNLKFNQAEKGSLQGEFKAISIDYNGSGNNALAFEMLESLQPGNNYTWNLRYQRSLSDNLQISIQYNGRKSEENRIIHAGGVEVRAFF
jgi:hypothetical protein